MKFSESDDPSMVSDAQSLVSDTPSLVSYFSDAQNLESDGGIRCS